MPSSRESSQPRDQTHVSYVSCNGRWVLYHCVTWEAPHLVVLTSKGKEITVDLYGNGT